MRALGRPDCWEVKRSIARSFWLAFGLCWGLLFSEPGQADEPVLKLEPIGKLPERIREASGLCKSRQHAEVFWTISDSGNAPRLYAIKRTGQLLAEFDVNGAINLDWESIDADDDGNLWIGDVGNNLPGGPLKVRWVYQVREPNPTAAKPADDHLNQSKPGSVSIERQMHFRFPDKPRDVEGLFVRQGHLYLVSKRSEPPTEFFRFLLTGDTLPKPTRDNRAKPVELTTIAEWPAGLRVTGTALDPSNKRLALCSYEHATVIRLARGLESLTNLAECKSRTIRFQPTDIEGCEWDGDDLLLVSEDRNLFCVPSKSFD